MSKQCKTCGQTVPDESKFCAYCGGYDFSVVTAGRSPTGQPSGQRNIQPEIQMPDISTQTKGDTSKKSKAGLIIIIIALLCVLMVVVGFVAAKFLIVDTMTEETENVTEIEETTTEAATQTTAVTTTAPVETTTQPTTQAPVVTPPTVNVSSVKMGFICLHDDRSTYDKNFLNAITELQYRMGLSDEQIVIKTNVAESEACYDAAVELVGQGCNIIFANSFGHEDFMIKAAREFPTVEFCHASGVKAHTEKLPNYHNAYAAIYEGRYLTGVAAGMKLNEMISQGKITAGQAKLGFVGSYTYAEVISAYTAFYLGAKSVCPTATMEVQFTGSWYEATFEKNAAEALIANGCVVISQYADSMGAPGACEAAGVPNISYNGSTAIDCPNTFVISSGINWTPYFTYIVEQFASGQPIATDWCGGISDGAVVVSAPNFAAPGTAEAIENAKAGLADGSVKVFDTSTFTVGGVPVYTYKADVDLDENFTPDTEAIAGGAFLESEYRSAPYFDLRIDGITLLNESFYF